MFAYISKKLLQIFYHYKIIRVFLWHTSKLFYHQVLITNHLNSSQLLFNTTKSLFDTLCEFFSDETDDYMFHG